tara:strand:+ start:111 stop:1706 length:1596 start_codon:yes stop_codon:yes gene_type:complete
MIKLRDYQQQAVDQIRYFFKKGNHAILQAPTGAGKTVIFSYIAQNAASKGKKVLVLTNRTELLTQTGGSLKDFGVDPYLIRAGTKYLNFNFNVFVAMSQTLRNRLKIPMWSNWIKNNVDLLIIDEAHLQDFSYIFESGLFDDKFVLGFTATPRRSGKMRQLALDYETIIDTISVKELVKRGSLVGDDYFGVNGANLNGMSFDKLKGDFDDKDMFSRFNTPTLYAGTVKNWLDISPGSHTIVFCVNVEHVIHTCDEFHKNGIDARFLVSGMSKPKEPNKDAADGKWVHYRERMRLYDLYHSRFGRWSGERTTIINKFKNKNFPVLINAGILTTGFDCPSIETVIINRATTSVTLWLQMIGRGSRTFKNKTHFNILDFGDNASRLGHYTSPQHWSLWHEASRGEGTGVPPVKECGVNQKKDKNNKEGCKRLIMASAKICPFCGYIYPKEKIKYIDLEGLAYDDQKHIAVKVKKIKDMDLKELNEYFKIKKHKSAWLWRQLYFRGGFDLIERFGNNENWKKGTIEKAKNYVKGL